MYKKVAVILILSMLMISELAVSIFGMNSIKNSARQILTPNYDSIGIADPEIQSVSSTSNAGYVKYPLDLLSKPFFNINVFNGNSRNVWPLNDFSSFDFSTPFDFSTSKDPSFSVLNASSILINFLVWVSQVSYSNGTFALAGGNGLITFADSGALHLNIAISGATGFQSYVLGYDNGFISAGTNYLPGGGITIYNYSFITGIKNMASLLPSSWTESNSNLTPYLRAFAVGNNEFLIVDEELKTGSIFIGVLRENSFINMTSTISNLSAPVAAGYGGGNFLLLSSQNGILINATTLEIHLVNLTLVSPPSSFDNSLIAWNGTSFLIAEGHYLESYNPLSNKSSIIYENSSGLITFVKVVNNLSFFGVYQDSNTTIFKLINDKAYQFLTLRGEINDVSAVPNGSTYVFIGNLANSLHSLMYLYTSSMTIPPPFPMSLKYQPYLNVPPGSSLRFNLSNSGPTGLSYGVMNTTMNISIYSNGVLLHSSIITGNPTNYSVILGGNAYGYFNFNATDAYIIVKNIGNNVGQFAYNEYDYYISNWTASMIEYPPQYAININPVSIPQGTITGISFTLVAPKYSQPLPLAIWIGAGGTNSEGKYWWAQIGFNNWAGIYETSYAGWGIFSNIFGNPGGTDYNYPLIPGDTYNFTMILVNNTTWEFAVNGTPIVENGLSGFYNTTTSSINWGFDLGLETITSITSSVNISNTVIIPKMFEFLVNGKWVMSNGASFMSTGIGENWWNGNTSVTGGIALWDLGGNLQNSTLQNNSLMLGENLSNAVISAVPISGTLQNPLYGTFYVKPENYGNYSKYLSVNDKKVEIKSSNKAEIVSLIAFSPQNDKLIWDDSHILKPGQNFTFYDNFSNLIIAASSIDNNLIFEYVINITPTYNVNFEEIGLPSGTKWYVNLSNGLSFTSTNSTITFKEPDGTYSYTIGTNNQMYEPKISSGTFTVNGTNVQILITFYKVTYNITLTESGLPAGTPWSVTLNGTTKTSTTNTITFSEPNGIYSYSIGNVSGYLSTPSSGTITVSNANVNQGITFTVVRQSITSTSTSTTSTVSTSTSSTVNTTSTTTTSTVSASSSTPSPSITSSTVVSQKVTSTSSTIASTELYAIVGVIIAVIVIAVFLFIIRRKR